MNFIRKSGVGVAHVGVIFFVSPFFFSPLFPMLLEKGQASKNCNSRLSTKKNPLSLSIRQVRYCNNGYWTKWVVRVSQEDKICSAEGVSFAQPTLWSSPTVSKEDSLERLFADSNREVSKRRAAMGILVTIFKLMHTIVVSLQVIKLSTWRWFMLPKSIWKSTMLI